MNNCERHINMNGLASKAYQNINNELRIAYENTADRNMQDVAYSVKCRNDVYTLNFVIHM